MLRSIPIYIIVFHSCDAQKMKQIQKKSFTIALITIELTSRKRANMLIDQSNTKLIDLKQNQLRAHANEMKISLAFSTLLNVSIVMKGKVFLAIST